MYLSSGGISVVLVGGLFRVLNLVHRVSSGFVHHFVVLVRDLSCLGDVVDFFSRFGDVVGLDVVPRDGEYSVHVFLVSSREDVGVSELLTTPGVVGVVHGCSLPFLGLDSISQFITCYDFRCVIFPSEVLLRIINCVRERCGSGVVYELGTEFGRFLASRLWSDVFLTSDHWCRDFLRVIQALGLGRVEVEFFDVGRGCGRLRVFDCFECYHFLGSRDEPYCDFMRGVVCGLVEYVLKVPTTCREVECVVCGGDCCVFEFEPRS